MSFKPIKLDEVADPLDDKLCWIYCDSSNQFIEILRKIWNGLPNAEKAATLNFVGTKTACKLPARLLLLQPNPLSDFGKSVVCDDPFGDETLSAISDYRDPCFYVNNRMVVAASSDHIFIVSRVPGTLLHNLGIPQNITIDERSIDITDL